ncbi:hypothetical protein DEH84_18500 (plasmid) [Aquabacterium olei]|uniref:HTH gntR-type domain-containing protein n=1 Tax=Aquabacterium olei TaxID=1296669 RepID=A0A2U8FX17_9BURK|nr:hypothetical protein DEH84_18500 [Aquabacterium olei]
MGTRYEELAEAITLRIREGQLRPGEKLPSVRQACQNTHLSPSTVFQAYYLLESRGLIEARPRSGYYVCAPRAVQAGVQGPAAVAQGSTEVSVSASRPDRCSRQTIAFGTPSDSMQATLTMGGWRAPSRPWLRSFERQAALRMRPSPAGGTLQTPSRSSSSTPAPRS